MTFRERETVLHTICNSFAVANKKSMSRSSRISSLDLPQTHGNLMHLCLCTFQYTIQFSYSLCLYLFFPRLVHCLNDLVDHGGVRKLHTRMICQQTISSSSESSESRKDNRTTSSSLSREHSHIMSPQRPPAKRYSTMSGRNAPLSPLLLSRHAIAKTQQERKRS